MTANGKFPEGFIWGAATAAHQVEGGNEECDLWQLEHASPSIFREPSGDACDQWNRFSDDIAVMAAMGLQSYRFSIEWARIEPEQGVFSQAALDHYQRCIDVCHKHGITPAISFHHFTLPLWQAKQGGLLDKRFAEKFGRYCEVASKALRDFPIACTINELNIPMYVRELLQNRLERDNGPAIKAAAEAALGGPMDNIFIMAPREAVLEQGLAAHARGRDAIKSVHPNCKVGVTLAIQEVEAGPDAEAARTAYHADVYDPFLDAVRGDDFIGLQTYSRVTIARDGSRTVLPGRPQTQMGWEDRPEALAATCRYVWERTQTPILVTENGIAGHDDVRRAAFIREALAALKIEMDRGAKVLGYYYWSLMDNYEWFAGYGPRFGLIAVDRTTQRRSIKPSGLVLGEIARNNSLESPQTAADGSKVDYVRGQEAAAVGIG
jgi:beta-glucosidase